MRHKYSLRLRTPLLWAWLFAFWLTTPLYAQVATNYVFSQANGTYTPITGGTVLATGTFDDSFYTQAIPSFTYNGTPYTSVFVGTNGWLQFGGTGVGGNYFPISSSVTAGGIIAPMGRDLIGNATGEIRYEQIGSELIFQWKNVRRYGVIGEDFSFQVRLNTGTGEIRFVYGAFTAASGGNPQVGLRGTTGADFNNRTTTTNWSASTPGAVNSATMTLTSTVFPASGLTFIWSPPPPCTGTPPVLTATATPTSGCVGSNVTLSVTPVFASDITYQWQVNTGSGFTNIAGATSATSVVQLPAVASVTYRCVVTCTNSSISTNSTPTSSVTVIGVPTYASLPYTQDFEATWQSSACVTAPIAEDRPDNSWVNTPTSGNPSWRQDNRGPIASLSGWTFTTGGAYTPTGALSTARSARFYSSYAPSSTTGDLDLYVDLSTPGPKLLTFYHINTDGSDNLSVYLSNDGGATFSATPLASYGTANVWTQRAIFINSNSPTAVIRFRATSDYGSTDIGVDQLNLDLATVAVSGLGGNIVASGSSADLANGSDYGNWFAGVEIENTFYVKNFGATNLNITGLTSSNTTNFQITQFPVFLVAPGDSAAFKIRFTANAIGVYNSNITLLTTGSPNPYIFQVAGKIMNDNVSTYYFDQCNNTYSEITGGTIPNITSSTFGSPVGSPMSSGSNLDDVSATGLPIGFTFNFDGNDYTTFSVNSNGYLVLGSTLPSNSIYSPISSTLAVPGIVSALSGDLQATAGEIRYQVLNSAPNRVLVVQWKNFRYSGATGDVLNFQVHLYEGSNQIRVVYGNITKNPTPRTTEVGLRGATNADFNNRKTTTNWAASTKGIFNNDEMTFTPSVAPASGLTFVWSPRPVQIKGGSPLSNVMPGSMTTSVVNGTDFGIVASGEQVSSTFVFYNNTSANVSISSITSSAPEFAIVAPVPTSVGSICGSTNQVPFTVRFTGPVTPGIYTSTITVNSNIFGVPVYTFNVRAEVINPDINVFGGTPLTAIPNGSTTPILANDTDFGAVPIANLGDFVERTYTIQNNSTSGILRITSVTSSNPRFTISVSPASPVAPSGSTTFKVRFTPTAPGLQTATISIVNNDPAKNPYTFVVRADAVLPLIQVLGLGNNIPNNKFLTTTTDGTFMGVANSNNNNLSATFTIRNNGSQVLGITSITVGSANSSFSISGAPSSVGVGDEADFNVIFNPANGGKRDTVIIRSNAANAPEFRFLVSAGGVVSALDFSQAELQISPNPSNGIFKLQINNPIYNQINAVVYDVAGKEVQRYNVEKFNGSMNIDLSRFDKGTYILLIESNGERIARKLIKQ